MRGQGRIFKRKERRADGSLVESPIWWISYCKRGHEFRESAQTTDENKARKFLSRRLKEREKPTFVGPKEEKLTLDDLEAKILVDYQKHNRRSAATVKHCLKGVKEFFSFDRLVDIGTERIDQYQETRLSQGAARATVNREMSYLRHGFKLLVEGRQISQTPVIKLLEGENIRQGFISKADFDKLVENLEPQARDIVIFLYNSGWRSKEAMTLEWRDVDVEGGMIRLRRENSKSKRSRALPLLGELQDVIERRVKERRLDCLFVFHRGGKQVKSFRKAWDTACVSTGFGRREEKNGSLKYVGLVPHDMRRSAVRNFRKAGLSENEGMAMSGHVTNSIYRRYDIIDEEDLKESMGKVQDYLSEQPKGAKVAPIKKAG
ncbi:MAG: site-specific integrase [Deltaproteobacteria bacterium]|nr:site-specific integrase [Deltaproteobacteria bacterium]